ncbi:hypothetical protein ABZ532_10590 [Streptomyces sp. NPDC019396]|uniref:hypothetical protein n=1 Tax=Streptomyces sp. NPDC019396 TaxID=3154687 RepID=UPI00340F022B
MRTYVGGQEAVSVLELAELAYGFELDAPMPEDFRDLFLGVPDETDEQRAVRLAAARDVLAELRESSDADEVSTLNSLYAEQLLSAAPLKNRAVKTQALWSRKAA